MTITTLIINELTLKLEHAPTQAELNSLSEYLATRNIRYLVELELAINDWKQAFTAECAWCRQRYLHTELNITPDGTRFCSDQCAKDYEEEHKVGKCTIE